MWYTSVIPSIPLKWLKVAVYTIRLGNEPTGVDRPKRLREMKEWVEKSVGNLLLLDNPDPDLEYKDIMVPECRQIYSTTLFFLDSISLSLVWLLSFAPFFFFFILLSNKKATGGSCFC